MPPRLKPIARDRGRTLIAIEVPNDLAQAVRDAAVTDQRSVAGTVRYALQQYISSRRS